MKITKIAVERVYNLGNYEHIRYSLTVDVKEHESSEQAIRGVENILAGLRPRKDIPSNAELARQSIQIARMEKMTAEEWEREHRHSVGTREEVIGRYRTSLEEATEKRAKALAIATTARELFDDLGGASVWKDAKENWDDSY